MDFVLNIGLSSLLVYKMLQNHVKCNLNYVENGQVYENAYKLDMYLQIFSIAIPICHQNKNK